MAEMALLEADMADPDKADQMEAIIERYGEVQGRFQELDGYSLDGFRAVFGAEFEILREEPITDSPRTLFLLRRR